MGKSYSKEKINEFPIEKYLDYQRDIKIVIDIDEEDNIKYKITTIKTKSLKLLKNIGKLIDGKYDKKNNCLIGNFDVNDENVNNFVLKFDKFKNLEIDFEEETITIPKIPNALKTLMTQKSNIRFPKLTYNDEEIKTDLHSHYTAMLEPEKLVALGLKHNVNYPVSHIYALDLNISDKMRKNIEQKLEQEYGKDILEKIQANKGNWKETAEIFKKYKIGMAIPFKNLVIGEPSEEKSDNLSKILDSCTLPKESQNTFTDMKETYANRDPFTNAFGKEFDEKLYKDVLESHNIPDDIKEIFTRMCEDRQSSDFKDNNMQEDMLLWIARNAREEGIDYIEMSHNALMTRKNQTYLNMYDKMMEKIEQETGTQLRFLVGISRTTKSPKFNANREYIKESLKSKYVVGIDILGEETNPTQNFQEILAEMTRYALNVDPDMVIRVHAGETNSYDTNIAKTVEIVYGEYLKKLEETQNSSEIKKPNLRIGHGIHGLKEELQAIDKDSNMGKIINKLSEFGVIKKLPKKMNLLDFMAAMETTVIERCISSNTLLSHQSVPGKDPIKEYLKRGIKCVLGTDGYGVYRNDFSTRVAFFYNFGYP